jgi:hypothetical protein
LTVVVRAVTPDDANSPPLLSHRPASRSRRRLRERFANCRRRAKVLGRPLSCKPVAQLLAALASAAGMSAMAAGAETGDGGPIPKIAPPEQRHEA